MRDSRLPLGAGIGFKPEHFHDLVNGEPDVSFIEVHAENYMGSGGSAWAMLDRLRQFYPLSVHGVGLSIGGEGPINTDHLRRVKSLCERFDPVSFSEHLAWSTHEQNFLNDLLPLPYTHATLNRVCDHIDLVQSTLKRQILLENPATYLTFSESTMGEVEFIKAIVARTGCGLLLDVNNVHISATNHGFSAHRYLAEFPMRNVHEIHLAGHTEEDLGDWTLLIDTHDRPVDGMVWDLFETTLLHAGPIATLVEWDQDIPPFAVLHAEAQRAADCLFRFSGMKAAS